MAQYENQLSQPLEPIKCFYFVCGDSCGFQKSIHSREWKQKKNNRSHRNGISGHNSKSLFERVFFFFKN